MNFLQAVPTSPLLAGGIQPGLKALLAEHRELIAIEDTRRLQHSLNLEAALTSTQPQMRQWDYAIGWRSASREDSCCFAEAHPANTSSATELVSKKRDVEDWLRRHGAAVLPLASETAARTDAPVWHWLATGASIAIRRGSQAAKQLAAAGISGPKRRMELS